MLSGSDGETVLKETERKPSQKSRYSDRTGKYRPSNLRKTKNTKEAFMDSIARGNREQCKIR